SENPQEVILEVSELIGFVYDSEQEADVKKRRHLEHNPGVISFVNGRDAQEDHIPHGLREEGQHRLKRAPSKTEIDCLKDEGYHVGILRPSDGQRDVRFVAVHPTNRNVLLYDSSRNSFVTPNPVLMREEGIDLRARANRYLDGQEEDETQDLFAHVF
ncbi:MAG: hypothetical protein KKD18_07245, partial [Nanoarchaeota archaeon]|nr:hypothetical protein [Nanoarchaeota archaeon]